MRELQVAVDLPTRRSSSFGISSRRRSWNLSIAPRSASGATTSLLARPRSAPGECRSDSEGDRDRRRAEPPRNLSHAGAEPLCGELLVLEAAVAHRQGGAAGLGAGADQGHRQTLRPLSARSRIRELATSALPAGGARLRLRPLAPRFYFLHHDLLHFSPLFASGRGASRESKPVSRRSDRPSSAAAGLPQAFGVSGRRSPYEAARAAGCFRDASDSVELSVDPSEAAVGCAPARREEIN
jgi:hypothetical protein